MEFIALDTETANNTSGSICSIGLARFYDNQLVDEFYSLIKPPKEMGDFSFWCTKVHGLSEVDVAEEKSFNELYNTINAFINDCIVVAHNAPFDSRHLRAITDYYELAFTYRFECSLSLARKSLVLPNYKLDTICESLDINIGNHHHALDDAIACGKIYAHLTGNYDV